MRIKIKIILSIRQTVLSHFDLGTFLTGDKKATKTMAIVD